MKKIAYFTKLGFGIFLVIFVAYSLDAFGSFWGLIFGALFLVSSVVLGVYLENHNARAFYLFSLFSFLLILSLYFLPLLSGFQYMAGGILVYFACSLIYSRKKAA